MPTSLPLLQFDTERSPSWLDSGVFLLAAWTIAMFLFAAIATFGTNTNYYIGFDLIPMS